MIGQIIAGMIVILVGFSLYPTIQEQVQLVQQDQSSNMTQDFKPLMNFVPFAFGFAIFMVVMGIIISAFRDSGLDTVDESYREEYDSDEDNHKQTYEEFVRERMNVERMMAK